MKKLIIPIFLFSVCYGQTVNNVTTNIRLAAGNSPGQLMRLVNGVFSNSDNIAPYSQAATNLWLEFGFFSPTIVTQITWNQALAKYSGDFKVQGSKDEITWVDLSGNIQLGSTTPQKISFNNSTPYSYYRLLGVAGIIVSVYWWEVQFTTPTSIPLPPPTTDTTINSLIRRIANEEILKQDSLIFRSGTLFDTLIISKNPKVKYKIEKL